MLETPILPKDGYGDGVGYGVSGDFSGVGGGHTLSPQQPRHATHRKYRVLNGAYIHFIVKIRFASERACDKEISQDQSLTFGPYRIPDTHSLFLISLPATWEL
jgi:hypothetical protein